MNRETRTRLEAVARDALARTRGDVVVAIARASGSYRDVDHVAAALASVLALFACLYAHFHDRSLPEHAILPALAALYAALLAVSSRTPWLRRALTTRARRDRQVREAARVAFVREGAGTVADRAGILLYVSLMERRLELVPDLGVEGKIETARWTRIVREAQASDDPAAAVDKALAAVGAALADAFPRAGDAVAPAQPRVRVRS